MLFLVVKKESSVVTVYCKYVSELENNLGCALIVVVVP